MFLFARVFALLVYSFALFIVYFLIKKSNNDKSIRRILFLYIIILSVMAYHYLPYKSADLYGIRNNITINMMHLDFVSVLKSLKGNRMPVATLYFWIFGKIGNLNLLPAVTAFIFYSNVFYILYESYKKYNWDSKSLAKVFLFFMISGQFLEVISGIRCLLGFSIIALCIFRENVLNKKILLDLPLYMCAVFLHDSCLVLSLISIVIYIFTSKNKVIYKLFYMLLLSLVSIVLIKKNPVFITSLFSHANIYISGVDEYGRNTYFYLWEYLIAFICMLFMAYSSIKYKNKKNNNTFKINKSYMYVSICTLIITFCFTFEYSIFERFRIFLMILFIPIIGNIFFDLKEEQLDRYHKKNYNTIFLFIIIIIYALSITRGNLCNLKFFE